MSPSGFTHELHQLRAQVAAGQVLSARGYPMTLAAMRTADPAAAAAALRAVLDRAAASSSASSSAAAGASGGIGGAWAASGAAAYASASALASAAAGFAKRAGAGGAFGSTAAAASSVTSAAAAAPWSDRDWRQLWSELAGVVAAPGALAGLGPGQAQLLPAFVGTLLQCGRVALAHQFLDPGVLGGGVLARDVWGGRELFWGAGEGGAVLKSKT